MTERHSAPPHRLAAALFSCVLSGVLCSGCDSPPPAAQPGQQDEDSYFEVEPQTVEEVHRNTLRNEPTDFLRSRSDDPIHWQGWSPDIFAHAEQEQRLVFAVIGSGAFPETTRMLNLLRKRPDLVKELNETYVCTLADVHAHPELALQMTALCAEIQRPVSFPVLAWFSHEGNPVAWLPLGKRDLDSFDEVFGTSRVMVGRIWSDSPRYVIINSARDAEARTERQALEAPGTVDLPALRECVHTSARALGALFDPITGEFDGGGGLLPTGLLAFTQQACISPEIPGQSAETLRTMTNSVCSTMLTSAIRDPLAGGFFAGRLSRAWDVPNTLKTADTQSWMAIPLAQASVSLENPRFLEAAEGALHFNDRALSEGTPGVGSYTVVTDAAIADRAYFWSQEKVRELLPEDEYEVAREVFALSGLGNIPFESDPRRDYFRKNTLAHGRSAEEVAAATGRPVAEVTELLASACRRLLAHREEILARADEPFMERSRLTAVNANYANALAHLARTTGNPEHHQRALGIRATIREQHHAEDGTLLRFASTAGRRNIAARGQDYAALVASLFSLYRNDLDPVHLADALALVREARDRLADDQGYLRENHAAGQVGMTPTYSSRMIFGPSTWGKLYGPLERLGQLTDLEDIAALATGIRSQLVADADEQPMIHTDFLVSSLIPLTDTAVFLRGSPGTPEFDALHQLLLQPVHEPVTILHATEGLPSEFQLPGDLAPGATVRRGGELLGTAATPADLARLLAGGSN